MKGDITFLFFIMHEIRATNISKVSVAQCVKVLGILNASKLSSNL
jgi:hypothetical protein